MLLNLLVPTTGVLAVHSPGHIAANIMEFNEHGIYTTKCTQITVWLVNI